MQIAKKSAKAGDTARQNKQGKGELQEFMSAKGKIKVIKKGEQVVAQKPQPRVSAKVQVREMVGNVTTWVSEFQHRKSEEAKTAFEQLFAQPQPQTNGA